MSIQTPAVDNQIDGELTRFAGIHILRVTNFLGSGAIEIGVHGKAVGDISVDIAAAPRTGLINYCTEDYLPADLRAAFARIFEHVGADDVIRIILPADAKDGSSLDLVVKYPTKADKKIKLKAVKLDHIMGLPRGSVITVLSEKIDDREPHIMADDVSMEASDTRCYVIGDTRVDLSHFSLPPSMFDGKPHMFSVADGNTQRNGNGIQWACSPGHSRQKIIAQLSVDHLPESFPPHEVDRVAAYLDRKLGCHDDNAGGGIAQEAFFEKFRFPTKHWLFVHHVTGEGAVVRVARDFAALVNPYQIAAVLPSAEAIAYASEIGRGSALTQQMRMLPLDKLATHIRRIPAEDCVVLLPSGSVLSEHGSALLQYDGIARVNAVAKTLVRPNWRLDVQRLDKSVDFFDVCGVIPGRLLNDMLMFGETVHEQAAIPTCHVQTNHDQVIAREIVTRSSDNSRSRPFRLIIDAQSIESFSTIRTDILSIVPSTLNCVVVGRRQLLLDLKADKEIESVLGIISLGDAIDVADPAVTAGLTIMPSICISPADMPAITSFSLEEFSRAVAFAVEQTPGESACRVYAARSPANSGESPEVAEFSFKCIGNPRSGGSN